MERSPSGARAPEESATAVVAALGHPVRRRILDVLRERDGRSVNELADAAAPELGRHAVLKHVRVLEDAFLITTTKSGRARRSYLNPVPLVALARRWIDDFDVEWGDRLLALRDSVERGEAADGGGGSGSDRGRAGGGAGTSGGREEIDMRDEASENGETDAGEAGSIGGEPPERQFAIVIRASVEEVWHAVTDRATVARWYFGTGIVTSGEVGSRIAYVGADGAELITGEVVEWDPPTRFAMTFSPLWSEALRRTTRPTRVRWHLEDEDGLCRVTITHFGLRDDEEITAEVSIGWPFLLSNLKSLIETGAPLR